VPAPEGRSSMFSLLCLSLYGLTTFCFKLAEYSFAGMYRIVYEEILYDLKKLVSAIPYSEA
jgi:hypothetical protein